MEVASADWCTINASHSTIVVVPYRLYSVTKRSMSPLCMGHSGAAYLWRVPPPPKAGTTQTTHVIRGLLKCYVRCERVDVMMARLLIRATINSATCIGKSVQPYFGNLAVAPSMPFPRQTPDMVNIVCSRNS